MRRSTTASALLSPMKPDTREVSSFVRIDVCSRLGVIRIVSQSKPLHTLCVLFMERLRVFLRDVCQQMNASVTRNVPFTCAVPVVIASFEGVALVMAASTYCFVVACMLVVGFVARVRNPNTVSPVASPAISYIWT